MELQISQDIQNAMIKHSRDAAPIESCGYLAGKNGVVKTFFPMTNIDNSPEHFTFDPKEQFQVLKEARGAGQSLLAVYHSHPASPARLSEEDVRLFNDPNMVYIIVSLMESEPDVKGYTVKKPTQQEVDIARVNLVVGGA